MLTGLIDPDTGVPFVDTNRLDGKPYSIPSYFTLDLAINYAVPSFGKTWARNLTLTVGANNLFNKNPPYVPVDGNPPGENNTVGSRREIGSKPRC